MSQLFLQAFNLLDTFLGATLQFVGKSSALAESLVHPPGDASILALGQGSARLEVSMATQHTSS